VISRRWLLERVLGAAAEDRLSELRREEPAQLADALQLRDLLRDAPFERRVPLADFRGQGFGAIVERLDAQHRSDPRDERAMIDRLGQVLVGAGVQPRDDFLGVGHRGDEDDRREWKCRVRAQPLADLDAIEPRHHDVEQDQVGKLIARGDQRLLAVGCGDDLVALAGEPGLDDLDVGRVVVDDEDAWGSSHGPILQERTLPRA
jgi:hypothetical protein